MPKYISKYAILAFAAAVLLEGCSSSNFGGASSNTKKKSTTPKTSTSAKPKITVETNGGSAGANGGNGANAANGGNGSGAPVVGQPSSGQRPVGQGQPTPTEIPGPLHDIITVVGVDSRTEATPYSVKNGTVEVHFSPIGPKSLAGERTLQPISIYFAVDVTNSMTTPLETIRDSINQFVSNLNTMGFAPLVGLVAFRDTIDNVFPLTADTGAFTQAVSGLQASGGYVGTLDDRNEASLLAIETALDHLRAEDTRADSMKTILAITDNPGHRNSGTPNTGDARNCSLGLTINKFSSLSPAEQNKIRLYHSTADQYEYSKTCSAFVSGHTQLDSLLANILLTVPQAERGSHISWPFDGNALINEFGSKLERIKAPSEFTCLATSADLWVDGAVYQSFNAPDLATVYRTAMLGQNLQFVKDIAHADLPRFVSGNPRLRVQRCCIESAAAEAGSFGACTAQSYTQNVDFKVTVK